MQIKDILAELEFFKTGYFPGKALSSAIDKQDEITPFLLDILQDTMDNTQKYLDSKTRMSQLYALFLLAQFREKKAYPIIAQILTKTNDTPYQLFGDALTENMAGILAAVCHDDLSLIKKLVEDEKVDNYVRSAALNSLVVLYTEDEIDRKNIIDYLTLLFHKKLKREQHYIWASIVLVTIDMRVDELMGEIERVYNENLLEEGIVDLDYARDALFLSEGEYQDEDDIKASLSSRHYNLFPNDIVNMMQNWACFDIQKTQITKPVKIGRNAPCPCGSGKKYKKCCLH